MGMPAVTMTSTTMGNAGNNPIGAVLVPGAPTILYCCAVPAPDAVASVLADGAVEASLVADGVGRIAIRAFSRAVPAAVHTAVRQLERAGLARLVFDVRDNPGGELSSAVELLRDLLPEGSVVARLEDADGDVVTYYARGDAYPWPLVVLVNGGTASAAEVFAGCLKAHGRALVVGERTYGKGTARAVVAGAFVDAATVTLPGGTAIDGVGVVPDPAPPELTALRPSSPPAACP
jgi:carboxyl-terminal processing protease